jgi:ribonuclease HI
MLEMLAKQVWRLVQEPESLCATVLRAKYFPQGDILKAGPKPGSSFTWQSIVAGLSTFKRGYVWRVGTGEKIDIWRDPWIPTSPNLRILSPRGNAIYTKVSELIDPVTEQWDEDLLKDLFSTVDVGRILQIPLNNRGFDDFVAWGFSKHGRYTVRSGYYLQWKFQFGATTNQLALPGSSALNPVWKILWRLRIPSKIKIFAWRALHGILPLKCILANRHIGTSAACPICSAGPEDIMHLLFTCPMAKELWNAIGIYSVIEEALGQDRSGSATLEILLRQDSVNLAGFSDIGQKEVIVISCWYLWWLRRRRTNNETVPPMLKCKLSILTMVANAAKITKPRPEESEIRWSRPETRQMKLNVDASFFADNHAGAVGALIRDYQGQFVAASCKVLPHVESASMAEAIAMKEGLTLANMLGCNSVIAEGDSNETIEACAGIETWWSTPAAVYADCLDLATTIGDVKFKYCPREANQAAHEIARFSYLHNQTCNWVDEPPSFILDRLINDVTIL